MEWQEWPLELETFAGLPINQEVSQYATLYHLKTFMEVFSQFFYFQAIFFVLCRGIGMAQSKDNRQLKRDCAAILESMKVHTHIHSTYNHIIMLRVYT